MSTVAASRAAVVTPEITRTLRAVRRRAVVVGVARVALRGAAAFLAACAVALVVDWLTLPGNAPWRPVLTAGAIAAGLVVAAFELRKLVARTTRTASLAGAVDRAHPEFAERWQTLAETDRAAARGESVHPALARRLSYETSSEAPRVHAGEVAPLRSLVRPASVVVATALPFLLALAVDRPLLSVLLQRFSAPLTPLTLTQIDDSQSNIVIPRGEAVRLAASLSGRVPRHALLELREAAGSLTAHKLDVPPGNEHGLSFRMSDVQRPFEYRWQAGDARSDWRQVEVADRPRLAELRFTAAPPAYTGRPEIQQAKLPAQIVLVEGTHATVAFRPDLPLRRLRLEFADAPPVDLQATAEGWFIWTTTVIEPFSFECLMTSTHGLQNVRPPRCRVTVYRDQAPQVRVLSPSPNMAVNPDDEIEIHFEASDDFAVERAELVVLRSSEDDSTLQPVEVIPIDLADQRGKRRLKKSVALPLTNYDLENGESLGYAIRVYDNRTMSVDSAIGAQLVGGAEANEPASPDEAEAADEGDAAENPMATSDADVANAVAAPGSALTADAPPTDHTPTVSPTRAGDAPAGDAPNRAPESPSPSPTESADALENASPAAALAPDAEPSDAAMTDAGNDQDALAASARSSATGAGANVPPASPTAAAKPSQPQSSGESPPIAVPDGMVTIPEDNAAPNSAGTDGATSRQSDQPDAEIQMPDEMVRRLFDLPQTCTSECRMITADETVGSFEGRQREKLAIAISPVLYDLDRWLAEAESRTNEVAVRLEAGALLQSDDKTSLQTADERLAAAEQAVAELRALSDDTPYAFVGLQIESTIATHITPSRAQLAMAFAAQERPVAPVRAAWQGIQQARAELAAITRTFTRLRRDHKLAEATEQLKKKYQLFIEDSLAELEAVNPAINAYERRIVEFDLDDEYLARLKEVLEMRNALRAELARVMQDDPRLVRRFMDIAARRGESLRDQMTLLAEEQRELSSEVHAWEEVSEEERPDLLAAIRRSRQSRANEINQLASTIEDRFSAWLPMNFRSDDPAFDDIRRAAAATSAAAAQLAAAGARNQPEAVAQQLRSSLRTLDAALRAAGSVEDGPALAEHLLNRLGETRQLGVLASSWLQQAQLLRDGRYQQEASIEQLRLAMRTDALAANMADLAAQLTAGAALPPEVVRTVDRKSRTVLQTLDSAVAASQLAASFALRSEDGARAVAKMQDAVAAMDRVESTLDELYRLVIDELDKLPAGDPIAAALNDPTLDQLLASLEREPALPDALGIPQRPSNLVLMSDWARRGNGNMLGGLITAQLREEAEQARRDAERARRQAINRALQLEQESNAETSDIVARRRQEQWNALLSTIPDDLRQSRDAESPQEFQRMIQQYFSTVSRFADGDSEAD